MSPKHKNKIWHNPEITFEFISCEVGKKLRVTSILQTITERGDFRDESEVDGRTHNPPARQICDLYAKRVFAIQAWCVDSTQVTNGRAVKNVTKLLTQYDFDDLRRSIDNKATETKISRVKPPKCANFFGQDNVFLAYMAADWQPPRNENPAVMAPAPKEADVDVLPTEAILTDAPIWGTVVLPALEKRLPFDIFQNDIQPLVCNGLEEQNARLILHLTASSEYHKSVVEKHWKKTIQIELNRDLPGTSKPYTVSIHRDTT